MKILCILKLNDVKTKIKAGTKEKNKMKWCSDYDPKYSFPEDIFPMYKETL